MTRPITVPERRASRRGWAIRLRSLLLVVLSVALAIAATMVGAVYFRRRR